MKQLFATHKDRLKVFLDDYGKVCFVGVMVIVTMCSVTVLLLLAQPKKLRVSFLDIGQGDAIFIQTPGGHDMLIDGGPSNIVLERLAQEMSFFDRDIDVMVATHGDADHVTGLIPVLEKYHVKTVVRSPVEGASAIFDDLAVHISNETEDVHVGQKGDVIDFGDGVRAYVLYPYKNISPKTETNESSVSIVLVYGEHSFLLTGDLGSKNEPQLIGQTLPKKVTVYKAGHHGSKYSSGEQLLSYIRPEYAVISAGKDNRYGHPNPEAIGRLQNYSQEILSTIDRGTITFVTDGRIIELEMEK